jgi:hypothetical protein
VKFGVRKDSFFGSFAATVLRNYFAIAHYDCSKWQFTLVPSLPRLRDGHFHIVLISFHDTEAKGRDFLGSVPRDR